MCGLSNGPPYKVVGLIFSYFLPSLHWVKRLFGSTLLQHRDTFRTSPWDRQRSGTCRNQKHRHEGCESDTTFTFKPTAYRPAWVGPGGARFPTSEMFNQMLSYTAPVNTNPWWVPPSLCNDATMWMLQFHLHLRRLFPQGQRQYYCCHLSLQHNLFLLCRRQHFKATVNWLTPMHFLMSCRQ